MFNSAFDDLTGNSLDFYPPTLRDEIDALNQRIYPAINNGVYRAGFATTQAAYEEAFIELFAELDTLETRLGKQRYLAGEYLTEADWRLFTSLIRFDAVYYGHFKCNLRRIEDYPQLCNWLRELYQWPGVAQTVNLEQIKQHYYGSHRNLNPSGIVPSGPALDFGRQHDRTRLPGQGVARR
jgi:putative glutathione S-transferase